jgi:hypothetical protein
VIIECGTGNELRKICENAETGMRYQRVEKETLSMLVSAGLIGFGMGIRSFNKLNIFPLTYYPGTYLHQQRFGDVRAALEEAIDHVSNPYRPTFYMVC